MRRIMKKLTYLLSLLLLITQITACDNSTTDMREISSTAEIIKGPHGGRLLTSDNFKLELSIFETGVPPEFRAWSTLNDKALDPSSVDLTITLTRLGGKLDVIKFTPHGDALRGGTVIYEPHSFICCDY